MKLVFIFLLLTTLAVGGAWVGYFHPALVIEYGKFLVFIFGITWGAILFQIGELEKITDIQGISPQEHSRLENLVRREISKIKLWAWVVLAFSAIPFIPGIINATTNSSPKTLTALAGASPAICALIVVFHFQWREEIRVLRSEIKKRERTASERKVDLESLTKNVDKKDLEKDPNLDGFRSPLASKKSSKNTKPRASKES